MRKIVLLFVLILGFLTMSGFDEKSVLDYISKSNTINILINGKEYSYSNTSTEYHEIMDAFMNMCEGGYEMPALGVSINESKKKFYDKFCIEFAFDKTMEHLGMEFNCLLIEINKDYCGFNILRGTDGIYNGRNYYFNLNKNMKNFYKTLTEKFVK